MFDLKGHASVVTGGNGGIGLGMARGLAKSGAQVAVWGRNARKNAAAVKELENLGARAVAVACDVSKESDIVSATESTLEELGRIDSCFANAGVRGKSTPFVEMSVEEWEGILNVNLTGVFLTFREVARHMIDRGGGGKLVVTSSIGSEFGIPRGEHYSASKAAVCALVRSAAVELARHDIQANAILPGWIDTEMTEHARTWDKMNEAILHRTPAKRWGTPDDFEGVAAYLASRESRFHTGDVLTLDGGYGVF